MTLEFKNAMTDDENISCRTLLNSKYKYEHLLDNIVNFRNTGFAAIYPVLSKILSIFFLSGFFLT